MVATHARKNDARRPATPGAAMHDRLAPDLATSETAGLDGALTSYPGGKNGAGIYQRLINLMPPHECYIEAFLGSGAILRRKKPAARNIGIDVDAGVIARWDDGGREDLVFINTDAVEWLKARITPTAQTGLRGTLIYCDPPYMGRTRCRPKRALYRHELLSTGAHEELLQILTTIPAMVMISGYRCRLYDRMLTGWQRVDYQAMTRGGTKPECVWINYAPPTELHDYRFLGEDFHDRCRIGRKIARWSRRLAALPPLERAAIIAALGVGAAA